MTNISDNKIRIGLIGAGANTRLRHIPGFQKLPQVEIRAVANQNLESSQKVASQFNIPKAYAHWQELINDPVIDAICIGTWPNMHCPITLAALDGGKHVLCEARMATNLIEAKQMMAQAMQYPNLITQLVPAPFTLALDETIKDIIQSQVLGDLISIDLSFREAKFPNPDEPPTWRQKSELSGFNTMTLGIFYETLMRWVGPATNVFAKSRIQVPRRLDEQGITHEIKVPDHLEILANMSCGATAHLVFSQVCGLAPENICFIFGEKGTLKINLSAQKIYLGTKNQTLTEVMIPENKKQIWRVEEEFVAAILGKEKIKLTTFADGVAYMAFTEAVLLSCQQQAYYKVGAPK